jgi:diguanylate cyclase (GGDEF)-like protein
MASRPVPTDAVLRARHYAARFRIALALIGAALVVVDPQLEPHPTTAVIGCLVIFLSGLVVYAVADGPALRIEEPVSCLAAVLIIGFGHGTITPISMIWLVAAAVGVLARGGRVGPVARVIVAAMLFSPLVTTGTLTAENIALIICSGALLLATGRVTLETTELLGQARYDADHDALTGALSISALRVKLDELAASGRSLYMMIIDLDDFAHVNKRRGHAAGDALLVDIAHAIEAELGPDDVMARIDGDAMGVIGFDSDGTDRAVTMLAAVDVVGAAERVTASIGIARAPRDGNDAEALLGAADVALRIAKRTGKHRASLYAGDPLVRGASGGAREALNRIVQGKGLWMAVQPIVNTLGGSVHCYEALARFDGGQGPLHWFELAEELGMRGELEIACLRKTLELLDELPPGTKLTVNLSVPMLCEPIVDELLSGRQDLDRLIV